MPVRDQGAARERLVGAQEAARFLGVHRSTLHAAVQHGSIVPDVRTPGGHMRFSAPTLEAFRARLATSSATCDSGADSRVLALASLTNALMTPASFDQVSASAIGGIRVALPRIDISVVIMRSGFAGDQAQYQVAAQHGLPDWAKVEFHRLSTTFKFATTAALRSRKADYCDDVGQRVLHAGTARLARGLGLGSYAILPLVVENESLGALVCASRQAHALSDGDRVFLQGIADALGLALAVAEERIRLRLLLCAGERLTSAAFRLRSERAEESDTAGQSARHHARVERLRTLFQALTGALDVCALGFGADLPPHETRLLGMTCEACAGDGPVQEHWTAEGSPRVGLAASVPLANGCRAGVGGVWAGTRPRAELDHALLVSFAGAYAHAVGLP